MRQVRSAQLQLSREEDGEQRNKLERNFPPRRLTGTIGENKLKQMMLLFGKKMRSRETCGRDVTHRREDDEDHRNLWMRFRILTRLGTHGSTYSWPPNTHTLAP